MLDFKILEKIPNKSGVYIFKKGEEYIYIGKAKELKKRLTSHFKAKDGKSKLIVEEADDLQVILLDNEKEALILEANMIYKYKPKYNAMLKDTQVYPYIRISNDEIPYLEIVRNRKGEGEFYGPFTNVYFTRQLFEVLRKVYKFRTCKRDITKLKKPCMDYHLGLCSGVCINEESPEDYKKKINEVKNVLKGKFSNVISFIKLKMEQHARLLDFENAAKYRDILLNFNKVMESQGVVLPESVNIDLVVGKHKTFLVFKIRSGYLISKLVYEYDGHIVDFIELFYTQNTSDIPEKIIVEKENKELKNIAKILGIKIAQAKDDLELQLLNKAIDNLNYEIGLILTNKIILKQMKELLGLMKLPNRIEGIDISHLAGKNTVASLVVFENGEIKKEEYRRYKLGDILDDFESIRIVVKKRYTKHNVPDLLFIDGGIGQVNAAYQSLKEIGKERECDVIGLAKEEETIVTLHGEIRLAFDHPVLRLLVKIRDETHRVANEFTRNLSTKKSLRSILDEIKWIGPKRKKTLLERYTSIEEILSVSRSEIEQLIGKKATESLLNELSYRRNL
ncbi:excinuclease ABC subunit UvrC [Fervidobacterium nodosum]|uniref:UvrABC system protein C n=1 Tax=Fervidobacterium nodosum (strain ATCC 35602 / DSM 5306 / Rt17-B1) TaxID=381764 RepID=UVRC_FERNB|nr:excinuclease ABC subunit UvrC [Fervidobacterium nodosum]A7HJI0.1 RecName: Full=UvrABC system protein C; Short=Protein UvrC; AltName: Full=Excinuclease ABC subunit C [Fervidobacterium nodosum Rt17-B1]ABS60063.1 excinuclease ABC, C subunit [Fervidobacterium nodosum Rt17-B1]PHJ14058.1 excinuclease ABC subunit C [Fervidobacterium sp. SC_NGM5_G05]